jgi:acetylornithine deacetylase/succinyl-diaminopimelate desuccinylase-like protein
MATTVFEYYHENRERFLQGLTSLLKIPSISTLPEHKPDIRRAVEFLANELREMGMKNVEIIEGKESQHPLLYAQ